MKPVAIKTWDELTDRVPAHALVANVDVVVVRIDDGVSCVVRPMRAPGCPHGRRVC